MSSIYQVIKECRICGNRDLIPVVHLGEQCLTGIFPKSPDEQVPKGPLEVVKCNDLINEQYCGLVQLKHSYESSLLYGDRYGYRSSLNQSMVDHLKSKVDWILSLGILDKGDLVVDIGSNDATLLKCYLPHQLTLVGVDPSAGFLKKQYPAGIDLIVDFFSADLVKNIYKGRKAKAVTSIAMFYDLRDPLRFMSQVYDILDDEGIWLLEQSYMPSMLEETAYDTICHEHMEYYGLKPIAWMAQQTGFTIIKTSLNAANGGSFEIVLAKKKKPDSKNAQEIARLLAREEMMRRLGLHLYEDFKKKVFAHRDALRQAINRINDEGNKIIGYGASTKGNVVLQFCSFTPKDIPFIAEVNPDKFGAYTPGTSIPIISEEQSRSMEPEYMMVLPWHFKKNTIAREQSYLNKGGKLFFPLPQLEIISR